MILHLSRMRRKVNRKIDNDQKNVSDIASLIVAEKCCHLTESGKSKLNCDCRSTAELRREDSLVT